jgi:hypothetical protein
VDDGTGVAVVAGVSLWSGVADGLVGGVGCGNGVFEAAGSGGVATDCLLGDSAGAGVGRGVGVGLGTTSIFWRLFRNNSRKRCSSSVCWLLPVVDPRARRRENERSRILSLSGIIKSKLRSLSLSNSLEGVLSIV